jgi:hypothetical protein
MHKKLGEKRKGKGLVKRYELGWDGSIKKDLNMT